MVQEKRARSYIPMDDRPRKCCVEICNGSALASSLAIRSLIFRGISPKTSFIIYKLQHHFLDFQASQLVHETLNSNLHPIVLEGGSAI
jgi:hypothetical protein